MGTYVGIDCVCRIRRYWPGSGLLLANTFDNSGCEDSKALPRAGLWLNQFTFGNCRRHRQPAIGEALPLVILALVAIHGQEYQELHGSEPGTSPAMHQ